MTVTVLVDCPVCWRRIAATASTGRVWRHLDKANHSCPMSGHYIESEAA